MTMKTKIFVVFLVLAVAALGCAKAPTEQMTAAESAISAATSAEAQTYAPEAMAAARDSLAAAKAMIEAQSKSFAPFRKYGKAEALLTQAQQAAQEAETEAQARKAEVKSQVEGLLSEATAGIDSAAQMLSYAPAGKDNRADLEMMKADLDAMRTSLSDVQTLVEGGQYMEAQTKAQVLVEQLQKMNAELAAATANVKAKKS